MNYCKICGEPAPEGKDLCWICEHTHRLPDAEKKFAEDINVPGEECEACKIPSPGEGGT